MSDISWKVIDAKGESLFHIDYCPPIGSTLHFYIDPSAIREEIKNEDYKKIDGKDWTVVDIYCEVRLYGDGKEIPVHFVEVKEKI